MIPNFEKLIKELPTKPSWGAKELIVKLEKISTEMELELEQTGKLISVSSKKKNTVTQLKKYDILYLPLVGVPHYFMVHKIVKNVVYGVIFTSKDSNVYVIHRVTHDRILEGSYVSNAYLCVEMDAALKAFIRTYEDKKEGNLIFKKVAAHYQSLFKMK
jgi:hypothetical protein